MPDDKIQELLAGFRQAFRQYNDASISGFSKICRVAPGEPAPDLLDEGLEHFKVARRQLILAVACLEAIKKELETSAP